MLLQNVGGILNETEKTEKILEDGSDGLNSWDVQRAVQRMQRGARTEL